MKIKTSSAVFGLLALCTIQGDALAADFDFYGALRGINPERYGCCLIRADAAANAWEYIEDTSFGNCYKWAKAVGNPYQYHQDKKFEFHRDRKCAPMENYRNATPSQYTYYHDGNS